MVTKSLFSIGGIVDGIVGAFESVADWIVGGIESIADGLVNQLVNFFMTLIYYVLQTFFLVIDFINLIFRKMCGLDTVRLDSAYSGSVATGPNGELEGDLALALIQSQQVIDVFISLLIVAVILLFVFTFIAIIKNQYNPEKSKGSNGPIIGTALKALFTFLFVPAICIFGIFVSNGLLKTIDNATRITSATSMSGQIFKASANSANRIRTDDAFWEFFAQDTAGINPSGMFTSGTVGGVNAQYDLRDRAALAVDEAFATQLSWSGNINASYDDGLKHMQNISSVNNISKFDYMNVSLVWVYYDLTKFNWLMAFVSCFFVGAALLVASIGVIQRLYEITILFAISPPFVSLMPLDGGKAFGGWKQKFVENVLIMYGTIVAINFFFIISPVLQNIDLFYTTSDIEAYGASGCQLFNDFAHVLFIICGALMIKDVSKLLNTLITGNDKADDLFQRGGKMQKAIGETVDNAYKGYKKAKEMPGKVWGKMKSAGGKAVKLGKLAGKGGMLIGGGLVKGGKLAGKGLAKGGKGLLKAGKTAGQKAKHWSGTQKAKWKAWRHGMSTEGIADKRNERLQRRQNAAASEEAGAAALGDLFNNLDANIQSAETTLQNVASRPANAPSSERTKARSENNTQARAEAKAEAGAGTGAGEVVRKNKASKPISISEPDDNTQVKGLRKKLARDRNNAEIAEEVEKRIKGSGISETSSDKKIETLTSKISTSIDNATKSIKDAGNEVVSKMKDVLNNNSRSKGGSTTAQRNSKKTKK